MSLIQTTRAADPEARIQSHIGVQLFTVRELLTQRFEQTLSALAQMGYTEFEWFGFGSRLFIPDPLFGLTASKLRQFLDRLGVVVPSVQFSGLTNEIPWLCDITRELGVHCVILGMAEEFLAETPRGPVVMGATGADQMRRLADRLNVIGTECRRNGQEFAYHNHHMEFASWAGETGFDILVSGTDPALVRFELDLGWVKVAGYSGLEYLLRYPGRFVACHLKDFDPTLPQPTPPGPIPEMTQLVPPGRGDQDFAKVLACMEATGVRHGYVEVDAAPDPLAACRLALTYLKNLKL